MGFIDYIYERFGITIDPIYEVIERRKDVIIKSSETVDYEGEKVGIVAGRVESNGYKPTTDFIQLFGGLATRNVLIVSKEKFRELLIHGSLEVDGNGLSRGYVVISTEDFPLGCGFYDGKGGVKHNIPKSKLVGFIM